MSSTAVGFDDPSTFSNPASARVTHTDFEIDVDFEANVLHCWCAHTVTIAQPGATELVLDTRALDISSVTVDGAPVATAAGPSSDALGAALVVPLPHGLPQGTQVRVDLAWQTSPDAVAVQWLSPEQTVGGKHPYLFSQCQAIHARSMCPCQDSPGAKFTYTSAVRVPADLTALMSALPGITEQNADLAHLPPRPSRGPTRVFTFNQPMPISSYLLALAVGDLASRDLSPVSRVWSEPGVVDAARFEFEDTPQFLEAAAAIAGPYRWERYDLLVLPSSFPYGGMENPVVTFVTPTLLAGDKSLANVVAHEISHSWTGNLVTNKNWQSFFLNEGWTVWLERRILGHLEGEKTFQFHASMGWGTLVESVGTWGADHPYTRLVPDLSSGVDPDDAFSSIPYEKGFALLAYLETLVGGKEPFIAFFKAYVQKFADTPLGPDDFRAYFTEYFEKARGVDAVREVDWDTWFYGTGMPPVINHYDEELAQKAYSLAKKWHTSDLMGLGTDGPEGACPADLEGWSSAQVVAFLDRLGELRAMTPLAPRTTRALAAAYPILESSNNCEVRCAWYLLCVKAGDATVLPRVAELLTEQARMKFLRPLYRALAKSPKMEGGKELALVTFEACKGRYHPIAAKMVSVDLGLANAG